MRNSFKRVGGVIAAMTLVLSTVAASANASIGPTGSSTVHPADGDVDDDPRVAHLVDKYGISASEAATRVEGQRTIARASAILGRDHPYSFGGLWVDHAGGGHVVLRAVDLDPQLLQHARELLGDWSDRLTPVPANYTLTELRAAHRTLLHFRDELMSMEAGNIGMRIDIPKNQVTVFIGEQREYWHPNLDSVLDQLGDRARVAEENLSSFPDCDPVVCDPPLRGGLAIDILSDTRDSWCTSGFVARGTGAGSNYLLTAGHCVRPDDPYWYGNTTTGKWGIGPTSRTAEGGMSDVASILVAPATTGTGTPDTKGSLWWDPQPAIFHNFVEDYMYVYGKNTSPDDAVPGTLVCRTGYVSGVQCGEIVSNASSPHWFDKPLLFLGLSFSLMYTGLLEADLCAAGGDSGGPWYDWHYAESGFVDAAVATAYGIHHSSGENETCTAAEHSFATHIAVAEAHMSVEVKCVFRCNTYT